MKKKIICCVAGHSGGHIIPCITLAQREIHPSVKHCSYTFFSSGKQLDYEILKNYSFIDSHIPLTIMNIPYKKWWKVPLFLGQVMYAFCKSIIQFIRQRPEKIICTGGYLSIPVCMAGKLLFIPIDVYELNVTPGQAMKVLKYLSTNIFVCFNKTKMFFRQPTHLTQYPIRFFADDKIKKTETKPFTHYLSSKKTILVLGGSQGSDFLNHQICQLVSLCGTEIQIIHQTGHAHITLLKKFYDSLGISAHVFAYEQNLAPYYQVADIIICRSGAGTLFETLFFEKPYITIPLETHTTNHQVDNAYALHDQYPDKSLVIRQKELLLDPLLLFKKVSYFFDQPR